MIKLIKKKKNYPNGENFHKNRAKYCKNYQKFAKIVRNMVEIVEISIKFGINIVEMVLEF